NTLDYAGANPGTGFFNGTAYSSAVRVNLSGIDVPAGPGGDPAFVAKGSSSTVALGGELTLLRFRNVIGGAKDDSIYSGGGNNTNLSGGKGDDVLTGGLLIDNLNGDGGDDTLIGGGGNDVLIGGADSDTYKFAGDWGQDKVVEAVNGGKSDTLDFSAVTRQMTFDFLALNVLEAADNAATANSVKRGDATSSMEIEKIISGSGAGNLYNFSANWGKSISIDNQLGAGAIVDFSNVPGTVDLTFTIEGISEPTFTTNPYPKALNKVTVTDGEGHTAVIYNVYSLTGGQGDNVYKFKDGGVIPGILTGGPVSQSANRQNTLDYSEYGQSGLSGLVGFGGDPAFINLDTTSHSLVPHSYMETLTEGVAPVKEVHEISTNARGGTFTLTFFGETTDPIPYDVTPQKLQTILKGGLILGGIDMDVVVTQPASGVWRIEFQKLWPGFLTKLADGALGLLDKIDVLKIIDPTLPTTGPIGSQFIVDDSKLGGTITFKTVTKGVDPIQEVWQLANDADGGTFTLTYNGHDTTALNFDASANDIQTALNAPAVNANVTVASATALQGRKWTITFNEAKEITVHPAITVTDNLDNNEESTLTQKTAGTDGVKEVRTLTSDAVSGKFTLKYNNITSDPIDFNATAQAIKDVFQTKFSTTVTVTGDGSTATPWKITFQTPGPIDEIVAKSDENSPLQRGSVSVTRAIVGVAPVREVRKFWTDAISGTFSISYVPTTGQFLGQLKTITISPGDTASSIQTKFKSQFDLDVDLPGTVIGLLSSSGTATDPWVIRFLDPRPIGTMYINDVAIVSEQNVWQDITVAGKSGAFTLSYGGETTRAIA
ncbi:MAG TPA: hypothetical protein VFO86_13850, partial [Terriglobia bacterium]|nr:hypothetical protein [Terriglobia bacterium]